MLSERILIGTASFGSTYGIANSKHPTSREVSKILNLANKSGFLGLDTARDYVGSESQLGLAGVGRLNVFSKFSHGTNLLEFNSLRLQIEDSCKRLGVDLIHGMAPHSVADFLSAGRSAERNLTALKEAGTLTSWGLSLYEPQEFFRAIEVGKPDYIQIPQNIFDRRFADSGAVDLAKKLGIRIQVRSIFLQGALLLDPDNLPDHLSSLAPSIANLRDLAINADTDVGAILLHHSLADERIDEIVLGVNTFVQIEKLQASLSAPLTLELSALQFAEVVNPGLLDPRGWGK